MPHTADPLVSVVVCSYSTERLADVKELLSALGGQSYRRLEVVFVGERSREITTVVEAHARTKGLRNVQTVFNTGTPGLAAARNLGVCHARGDIIAFLDDDALPFPDWARELARTFASDANVIGATGPALPLWQDGQGEWFPPEFQWIISCTGWFPTGETREVRNAWGMNMAFRRAVFERCRFDERLGGNMGATDGAKLGLLGEDTAFSLEARRQTGGSIVFNPAVRVLHKVYAYRFQPRFVRRRAFWEGYTKAWLRRRQGQDALPDRAGLATEYRLLRHIALGFLPAAIGGLATNPARSWRRLSLAADALLHVGLGYAAVLVPPLGRIMCKRYGQ